MNTLISKVRKSLALLSIGALLSTMVVVSTASAAWYDAAVAELGDPMYATMTTEQKEAALNATTSRQDAAVILHRATGSVAPTLTVAELPFTDKGTIAPYALNAVLALYEAGVVTGNPDGTFAPAAGLNRASFVVMLDRAGLLGTELAPTTPAVDAEFVGVEWSKAAFQKAAASGIVQGYPDGTWRPAGLVNKAEAFTLSFRATGGVVTTPPVDEEDEDTPYDIDSPLKGRAGSIEVSKKTADLDDEVTTGEEDVKVLSFEVEAKDSDVALTNLRVAFERTALTPGSTRLDRVADEVSVWQGGREVGRESVSTFTKNSNEYSRNISLENAVVRQDDKIRFFVAVTANSVIDTANLGIDWDVAASNIRFEDATGVVTTDSVSVADQFKFENLASSGKVELRFSENENNPKAGVAEVSKTASKEVTLLIANVTAKGGQLEIESLPFSITPKGESLVNIAEELYLYVDGKEADSVSTTDIDPTTTGNQTPADGATASAVFIDLEDVLTLAAGETVELKVTAKAKRLPDSMPSYLPGDSLGVSFTAANRNAVVVNDSNYDSLDGGSRYGTVTGNDQKLYSKGLNTTFAATTNTRSTNESGKTTAVTHTLEVNVTAFGETYFVPQSIVRAATVGNTDGFAYTVTNQSGDTIAESGTATSTAAVAAVSVKAGQGNVPVENNRWRVDDGKTVTFLVTVDLTAAAVGTPPAATDFPGFVRVQLNQLGYGVANNTNPVSPFTLVPTQDFQSDLVNINGR